MASRSLALRSLTVLLAAIALWAASAAPSSAHSRLVSTDPADGSVLASSPTSVSFTFDEPLLDGMNTISINDANGEAVTSSRVTPEGQVITLPIATPLTDGTYQAAYRVVSADGHAVMGAISFTVAAGSAEPSTSTEASSSAVSSSAKPSTGAASAPAVATSSSAVAVSAASSPAPSSSTGGAVWMLWVGIAILVAALVAAIGLVVRRGR